MKDQGSRLESTCGDIDGDVACRSVYPDAPEPASPADLHAELPYLRAVARRLTGNPQDAHDVVQDALVRALPALHTIAAGPRLRAWLVTIVRHIHIDRVRRVAREPRSVPIDGFLADSLPSREPEPAADDGMGMEDVEAALAALPETFRRVFVLHELEGRPYRDIAGALDIPLATVGTRLNRARTKLRALLAERRDATGAAAQRPGSHAERALVAALGEPGAGYRRRTR
jgi:RNA polymerase sigma-70 factor (ECF subfamily)